MGQKLIAPRRPRTALKNGTIMVTNVVVRIMIDRSTSFEKLKLIETCLKTGTFIVYIQFTKFTSGHCAATRLSTTAKIGCA